jgi:hypothetical protein
LGSLGFLLLARRATLARGGLAGNRGILAVYGRPLPLRPRPSPWLVFAGFGNAFALVGGPLALVADALALVGDRLTRVGKQVTPVGRLVALIQAAHQRSGRRLAALGSPLASVNKSLALTCHAFAFGGDLFPLGGYQLALQDDPLALPERRQNRPRASELVRLGRGALTGLGSTMVLMKRLHPGVGVRLRLPGALTRLAGDSTLGSGAIALPCLLESPGLLVGKRSTAFHRRRGLLKHRRQALRGCACLQSRALRALIEIGVHRKR